MTFFSPLVLSLLPAAVLLFLLARRWQPERRHVVSSLHFWRAARSLDEAQLARRRPRIDWMALLQAAFFFLLIVALAGPAARFNAPRSVFVVDISMSMGAREASGTRLDLARTAALKETAQFSSSARVRLISAGVVARDLGEMTAGSPALRSALDALRPEAAGARVGEGIQLAQALEPGVPLTVITDLASVPVVDGDVRWVVVGTARDNVAVTALETRVLPTSKGVEVVAEVVNFGAVVRDVSVVLDANGDVLGRRTLTLAPRARRTILETREGLDGVLSARLEGANDALPADDARQVAVAPRRRVRVHVKGTASPFVRAALEANQRLEIVESDADAQAQGHDLVVCNACSTVPVTHAPVLLIPPATGDVLVPGGIRVDSPGHPLLRGLDLITAHASPVRTSPATDGDVLMRAGEYPLAVVQETDGRRFVRLNLDLRSPAFALDTNFPLLIANAIDWLAADAGLPSSADAIAAENESDLTPGAAASTAVRAQTSVTLADMVVPCLAAALVLLLVESWLTRRRLSPRMFAMRAAMALLLILAIAGVVVPVGRALRTAVFLLDRSDSLPLATQREAVDRASDMMSTAAAGDRAAVIVFGAAPSVERKPGGPSPLRAVTSMVPSAGTDVEQALALGRNLVRGNGDRRLVLMSDGQQTSGDASREAAHALTAGIPIDTVAMESRSPLLARIDGVAVPATARVAEPFPIRIAVSGRPGSRVELRLSDDSGATTSTDVTIAGDGAGSATLNGRQRSAGTYSYRASLTNDEAAEITGGTIVVSGHPSLLHVHLGGAPNATTGLGGDTFRVTRATPPQLANSSAALASFDGIVLDDVPADSLTPGQLSALTEYVEQHGGGLLLLGSERSLERAGYPETVLGKALPIDLGPRAGARAPRTALVLAFDKSGSMADRVDGVSKMELARQAALKILGSLPATDMLGVIAFDARPAPVLELGAPRDSQVLAARLRSVEPGGPTAMAPALDLAAQWLRRVDAARRHVLLVSDGRTSAADTDRIKTIVRDRAFEFSIVGIGPDADREQLRRLAEETGGRAYFPDDIAQLPAIAVREATRSAAGTTVEEPSSLRAVPSHPIFQGVDVRALPQIRGYVVGKTKAGASQILSSHLDDPVLSTWRAGLGRVAVFTGDLGSSWSRPLTEWNGFPRFWMQTARWVARRSDDTALRAEITETDAGLHITVHGYRPNGHAMDIHNIDAIVRAPSAASTIIVMRPTAPGRFEADMETSATGAFQVSISAYDGSARRDLRVTRAVFRSGQRERLAHGVNRTVLASLAGSTGGRVLAPGESPFDGTRSFEYRSGRTLFGTLALLLFLGAFASRCGLTPEAIRRWWRQRQDQAPVDRAAA